jgi:hypothetical protein
MPAQVRKIKAPTKIALRRASAAEIRSSLKIDRVAKTVAHAAIRSVKNAEVAGSSRISDKRVAVRATKSSSKAVAGTLRHDRGGKI